MPETVQTSHCERRQNAILSLSPICPSLRQKGLGHHKGAQDLSSEWKMLCESVSTSLLEPPSLHLDTENPEKEWAGTWEGSYLLKGVVQPLPPTVLHIHQGGLALCLRETMTSST